LPFIRKSRNQSVSSADASSSTLSSSSSDGLEQGKNTEEKPKKKKYKMPFRQRMARHFGDTVSGAVLGEMLRNPIASENNARFDA
jgi:hypothetical protein